MDLEKIREEFAALGGDENDGFPVINSPVYKTAKGTPYLKGPGVALISKPDVNLSGAKDFLGGFDEDLGFRDYLADEVKLPGAEQLTKFAGQVCYASFGSKRTRNKDAQKYFDNIISSGHGSVLEHANFSFLWWGTSRSLTHEAVRHRAGVGVSQLSQRYVSGSVLRFVERPEYQSDEALHRRFEERIDRDAAEYEAVAEALLGLQGSGSQLLSGGARTDRRKKVQQAARSALPNETESSMVFTVNVRAGRHIANMRASEHAETEIRELMFRSFLCLAISAPGLYRDFEVVNLSDGTKAVKTNYPKV